MNSFPTSIAANLKEAGFSSTEILMLKNACTEDIFTLRQMAAKTGKSTGVLDQAAKKLLQKGILRKEMINKKPQYTLSCPEAIGRCIKNHTTQKVNLLRRKEQDIDLFVESIEWQQSRPSMEYYKGFDGMKEAYREIFQQGANELLQYKPVYYKEEDEPFKECREILIHERRRLGLGMKVIAHDVPLGRRLKSRDPFTNRTTVLVPQDRYPFALEQVIAGDMFVCFNFQKERACIIRFPEFVSSQSQLFLSIWNRFSKAE